MPQILPEPGSQDSQRPPLPSTFIGDVLKLATGTTLSQLLTILVTPILARLYDPSSFGVWGVYVSISTVIIVITCLRYELAIILPEKNEDAVNLFGVSIAFCALFSLIVLGLVAIGRNYVAQLLRIPELAPLLWLLPLNTFFGGAFNALNYWNTRTKQYTRLSIARFFNSLIVIAIQLLGGLLMPGKSNGLILGTVASMIVSSLILGGQIIRDDGRLFVAHLRWRNMRLLIARYKKFPLYGSWSALMNSISWQLPSFLLTYFFSPQVAGYYAVGNRLLRLPLDVLGSAVAQVFFQRSAESKEQGTLATLVVNTFRQLVIFSLFPLLTITLTGASVFRFLLGPVYSEAGVYSQILSVWTFLVFISSPMSMLFATLEKQEFGLKLNAWILISRFAALVTGGILHDGRLAIVLFAGTGILIYGYLNFKIMRTAGVAYITIFGIIWKNLRLFIPAALILSGMYVLKLNDIWVVSMAVFLVSTYYLYQFFKDPSIRGLVRDKKALIP